MTHYSYCEHVTASSRSKWHIRKLSEKGKYLGGGADTDSLCGKKVSWDLDIKKIAEGPLEHVCTICHDVYQKEHQK